MTLNLGYGIAVVVSGVVLVRRRSVLRSYAKICYRVREVDGLLVCILIRWPDDEDCRFLVMRNVLVAGSFLGCEQFLEKTEKKKINK